MDSPANHARKLFGIGEHGPQPFWRDVKAAIEFNLAANPESTEDTIEFIFHGRIACHNQTFLRT